MPKLSFFQIARWRAASPKIVAAAFAIAGLAPVETENAVANGDTRTISLYHSHTHESIVATFRVNGAYDQATLEKLNWFLRDWRRDEPTHMDPRLFDAVWETYRDSGSQEPIVIVSAYRSPETNAMLRRHSSAVAEFSQHMLGKAMDMHYQDVPMSRVREIAMHLQRGGVGYYPTAGSPFVHMDVGGVRAWPRMSREQLVNLFPDGKTVHIPTDGRPLARYEEARAEVEAHNGISLPTAAQVQSKGFFATLFGGGEDDNQPEVDARGGPRVGGDTRVAGFIEKSRGTNAATRLGSASAYAPAQAGAPVAQDDSNPLAFLRGQPAQQPPVAPTPVRAAPPVQPVAVAMAAPAPDYRKPTVLPESAAVKPAAPEPIETADVPVAPTPPHRPTELALASLSSAPTPPVRPTELVPAALPSVITTGGAAPVAASAGALAYASTMSTILSNAARLTPKIAAAKIQPARAALIRSDTAAPLDTPAAKLDRANFRLLTAPTDAAHLVPDAIAPAVTGLRRARVDLGDVVFAPPAEMATWFEVGGSSLAITSMGAPTSVD